VSYDIFLQYFDRGESRVATNAETAAVAALMKTVQVEADPKFRHCGITLADGSQLECYFDHFSGNGKPFDGGMIALRAGFSPAGAEFLAALLAASGCVTFAGGDPSIILSAGFDPREHFPNDLRAHDGWKWVEVHDGPSLAAAIGVDFSRWRNWASQIAVPDRPPP